MRPTLIATALVIAAGSAQANGTSPVTVDMVFQDGSFIHVLMRVTNVSTNDANRIEVSCDVFDQTGAALGRAEDIIHDVPANDTVVGEALTEAPPGGSEPATTKCRVVR